MKVKVQVDEWIAVRHNVVGWIEIPDEIPATEENAMFYIGENGVDIEKEDIDWGSVVHEEWDNETLKILEIQPDDEEGGKDE